MCVKALSVLLDCAALVGLSSGVMSARMHTCAHPTNLYCITYTCVYAQALLGKFSACNALDLANITWALSVFLNQSSGDGGDEQHHDTAVELPRLPSKAKPSPGRLLGDQERRPRPCLQNPV